mgnify:CR=1 FL=1
MPTRNEKIEFIRDVLRQARVRECIGKVCEECKFYDTPNCLETCYATELVDMGIVQLPAEKQNAPEAKTIDLSKSQEFASVTPAVFAHISDAHFSNIITTLIESVESYVNLRLDTYVNTLKKHSQTFLIGDGDGQYHNEQYVPVTTIDHIFSLLSSPERE